MHRNQTTAMEIILDADQTERKHSNMQWMPHCQGLVNSEREHYMRMHQTCTKTSHVVMLMERPSVLGRLHHSHY